MTLSVSDAGTSRPAMQVSLAITLTLLPDSIFDGLNP